MGWLAPPRLRDQKSSQSDTRKRTEIFYEFLYYLFDSFLIPLIRSNFYVTESSVDRYRLFFFRHDVWRYVAEPAMAVLKINMFEEVKTEDALRILQSRRLGYSQVRLLPKQSKMRPIMNLRRRTLRQGGKKLLGPSINTILGPAYSALKLEKVRAATPKHQGAVSLTRDSLGIRTALARRYSQSETSISESKPSRANSARVSTSFTSQRSTSKPPLTQSPSTP